MTWTPWTHTCNFLVNVLFVQEDLVDQVLDLQRFWMRKLFGFTVLKPTERWATLYLRCCCLTCLFLLHLNNIFNQIKVHRFTINRNVFPFPIGCVCRLLGHGGCKWQNNSLCLFWLYQPVWPCSVWLDRWSWVGIYGDTDWTGSDPLYDAAHPQVHW